MTTLVMAGILLFGAIGFKSLPVSDLPNVDFPTILVTANLPGARPETMAASVATPLERQFSAIAGLDSGTPPFFVTLIARVEGGLVSLWQGDAGYDTLDPDVPGPRNRLLMLDTGWVLDRS